MNNIGIAGVLAFALGVSAIANAQDRCAPKQSIRQCYDQFRGTEIPVLESEGASEQSKFSFEQSKEQKQTLTNAQTGVSSGGTATGSTVTDLVPLFDALGLISDSESDKGSLALNLNFLLPVQKADHNAQLQLLVNTSPKPLDDLVQAFPEAVRAAREDALQKSISTFGDSRLAFTYSLISQRFGRDYKRYGTVIEPIFSGAAASANSASSEQLPFIQLLNDLTQKMGAAIRAAPDTPIENLSASAGQKEQIRTQVAAVARAAVGYAARAQGEVSRRGLTRLTKLIDQQPQLLFTLSRDTRDVVVGPDRTSASLTFEQTAANLGDFLGGMGAPCLNAKVRSDQPSYEACAEALDAYFKGPAKDLESQLRWKFSASYHRLKKQVYVFPDDSVNLTVPARDRWEIALGIGRPLPGRSNLDRLDVEVSYDSNLDDDTTNKERVKATVTYTRRVGDVDMPFSIVYANKSEFLGDVDQQISLNLGIKFRSGGGT